MERDFIKLTIMQFGIVIIFNKSLATKQIAFSVVNDVIYSAIPLTALCDL